MTGSRDQAVPLRASSCRGKKRWSAHARIEALPVYGRWSDQTSQRYQHMILEEGRAIRAEVVYAVRREMATTIEDLLSRSSGCRSVHGATALTPLRSSAP